MALFSLSNRAHFSVLPSSSFSSSSTIKTLDSKAFLHHHHALTRTSLRKPILSFSLARLASPVTTNTRRTSFNSYFAAEDAAATTNNKEEDDQEDEKTQNVGHQQSYGLEVLIKLYKEAILDGDQKTISDIEAKILSIENEKNVLFQKVSGLSADVTSGKEKYIRLQADFDNFRKRSEKERLNVRTDAQGEVIESLLSLVDNFERAKQQLKLETEKEKKIDASYQGIYKQFVEIMRSLHVAAVATVGKPFDPSVHEAIAREESQEFKEGIIIQEFRRGFLLGDRLLRPAMVKVSSGPGKKKAPVATEKSTEQPATVSGVDER